MSEAAPAAASDTQAKGTTKVFSVEQLAKYRRVFDFFDREKKGAIGTREIATASKVLGYRLDKDKIQASKETLKSYAYLPNLFSFRLQIHIIAKKIIEKLDNSATGTLTFEEFLQAMPGNVTDIASEEHRRAEFRAKFQEFDTNSDGFVTAESAFNVLHRDLAFTESRTNALMTQFDVDEDGKLSYEEFVAFYAKVLERKKELEASFAEFDQEKKGYVSMEDAQRILGGFTFTDAEIASLVQAHDKNNDGKLYFADFVHFWGAN